MILSAMTLSDSIAITAVAVVIFTLAIVVLAVCVYSHPWGPHRAGRARSYGAPPAPVRPPARSAGVPTPRGGRHAAV